MALLMISNSNDDPELTVAIDHFNRSTATRARAILAWTFGVPSWHGHTWKAAAFIRSSAPIRARFIQVATERGNRRT